jgi:hypothetical protein
MSLHESMIVNKVPFAAGQGTAKPPTKKYREVPCFDCGKPTLKCAMWKEMRCEMCKKIRTRQRSREWAQRNRFKSYLVN